MPLDIVVSISFLEPNASEFESDAVSVVILWRFFVIVSLVILVLLLVVVAEQISSKVNDSIFLYIIHSILNKIPN